MIKVLRFLILEEKIYCAWFILGTMFLDANHPKGIRGQFPGRFCQGAIIFGVIFREQSSRVQLFGGHMSEEQFSLGAVFLKGSFPGGNYLDTEKCVWTLQSQPKNSKMRYRNNLVFSAKNMVYSTSDHKRKHFRIFFQNKNKEMETRLPVPALQEIYATCWFL